MVHLGQILSRYLLNKTVFIKNYIQARIKGLVPQIVLNNLDTPRLTDDQTLPCEGRIITMKEYASVLKSFQCSKAPGDDIIPIEFYITFWPIIRKTSHLVC